MDVEDYSENDSDYNPVNDNTDDIQEINSENKLEKKLTNLSKTSKRNVEIIWNVMQEEDKLYIEMKMKRSINYIKHNYEINNDTRIKNEIILSNIFGKKVAKKLSSFHIIPREETINTVDIRKRALESVDKIVKKRKITETRKFAGQEITVERTMHLNSIDNAMVSNKKNSSNSIKGLDSVLDTLKGPKIVSTVAKSSMDWDVYKEKEGIEEDLSTAAKDGFLTRKDFLERCDVRTYEVEKVIRVQNNAGGNSNSINNII